MRSRAWAAAPRQVGVPAGHLLSVVRLPTTVTHCMSRAAAASDRPIVIASNRGPVSFRVGGDGELEAKRGAGGLVSGIGPLVAGTGATWIAAALSEGDRRAARRGAVEAAGFRSRLLALDAETYRLAYDVVCNSVLWFAHHGLWELAREPVFDRAWRSAWEAYRELNAVFVDAIAEEAPQGAAVLVQDYHLYLVGIGLAERRPDLRVVHFSHTPFASPAWLRVLPESTARELLEGLAAHVACGFHTERWAGDYRASAALLGAPAAPTFVSALASDPDDIRSTAASPACADALAALEDRVGDRAVIGRVDRMELSKNLLRGFLAFDDLLEHHPEHRGRIVFVTGAYASRQGVGAYTAYREAVEAEVARINDRWSTGDWTPIHLEVEDDFPRSVALLRRSDVLLVNPIRDGLNLVAMEGVLVGERHPVLCLSPEAGAHEQLGDAALTVPPYDVAETGEVLHRALTMHPDERRERAERLRRSAEARTPRQWLDEQLAAAT
jgi:trehalose 6-phosphate synthase